MRKNKGINITGIIFKVLMVLILAFVIYTLYIKISDKMPSTIDSNNNNISIKNNEFTKLEAKKLFDKIVKDPAINYSFPTKESELLLKDMTLEQKLSIVFSNMEDEKLHKVCNTELEDELLQIGFLSSKSTLGSECFNYYASVDDVLTTAKLVFGSEYTLNIENNIEKVVPYYYFEDKNIVVFKYSNTTYQEFGKLISFKTENEFSILNIELNYPAGEGYAQEHYKIRFVKDNGSYYFYSIERI